MRKSLAIIFVWLAVSATAVAQPGAAMARAREAFDKNDLATALTELTAVLKSQPANLEALTLRGRVFVRQSKFAEALADAERVIAKDPKNYEALNVRGVARREFKNESVAALADFLRAAELKPDYYFAQFNIGLTYARMNQPDDALAAFNRAAQIDPRSTAPYQQRASIFMRYRKYREAIAELDKAIALGPNDVLFAGRSYAWFRLALDGDEKAAERMKADSASALGINPENAVAIALRGVSKYVLKDCPGAVADADRAGSIEPKNYLPFVVRGLCREAARDHDGAFDQFDAALKLIPNDKSIKGWREKALGLAKGPAAVAAKQELVQSARLAVADAPWDFTTYDQISDLIGRIDVGGDLNLKRNFFEQLLAENPENICAMRFFGEYKARNYIEMIAYWDGALAKYDGKNGKECAAEIAFRIGREYNSRNRFDLAETYFARAKELKPDLKYLDGNIAANRAEKAENERPVPPAVTPQPEKNTAPKTPEKIDPAKQRAAIFAYGRVHPMVESDLIELNGAIEKYNSAGGYAYLYRGTRERILNVASRASNRIRELLKEHGANMPIEMRQHLEGDIQKIWNAIPDNF